MFICTSALFLSGLLYYYYHFFLSVFIDEFIIPWSFLIAVLHRQINNQ
jgi:hypothetical protein